jgi:hypothetical protein
MKIRTVIGLAAIGGLLAYMYKQRGGEFTMESFKRTMRDVFARAKSEARDIKERADKLKERAERQMTHEVANTVSKATDQY